MANVYEQIAALNAQIAYQQQILDDSDKYIIRSIELSQSVYPAVTALRATARAAIMSFQSQIAALQNPSIPNPPDQIQEAAVYPAGAEAGDVVEQADQGLPL